MYRPTYGYNQPPQSEQRQQQQQQQPQTFQYSPNPSFNQQQSFSSGTTPGARSNLSSYNAYLSQTAINNSNNNNTQAPPNRAISNDSQANTLRGESPQILQNENEKASSFPNRQYSYNSAIRQSTNNQIKSLPSSPIQGQQQAHSYQNTENFGSHDIVTGLTQPATVNGANANYHSIDISRIVHSPGGNELPTLPPLNPLGQSSPHQERMNGNWSSNNPRQDELARSSSNTTLIPTSPTSQQNDSSILMQYHNDRNRLVTSAYPPQPQPQQQQQQQNPTEIFGEIGSYGCGVTGCFISFSASSDLFHHIKSAHANLDPSYKPYRCAMVNCTKRYKNINGLQYHLREAKGSSGHGYTEGDVSNAKPFQCQVPSFNNSNPQ
ncbi:hypothetical protein CU098_012430 [Rhizopus stolonifer]|uniref:C2H2-type domain-containing protein n=1 Tax=Rhizopus stolonifer TaxID=4846 RepID=A0A367KMV6_RHIST|nr:hypothetical protein CU098_012430 [Rhizopus stolonifer]